MKTRILVLTSFSAALACSSGGGGASGVDGGAANGGVGATAGTGGVGASAGSGGLGGSGGAGGSAGTAGSGATGGTAGSGGAAGSGGLAGSSGGTVTLSNAPTNCNDDDAIAPYLPNEAGHLAAATLTPSSYPVTINAIHYQLRGQSAHAQCITTLPHRVEVYVSATAKPDNEPSKNALKADSMNIPEDLNASDPRTVDLPLNSPITLTSGQALIVAVEMAATATQSLCIRSCKDGGGTPNRNWWSNAAQEPYSWADLTSLGINSNCTTWATGTQ